MFIPEIPTISELNSDIKKVDDLLRKDPGNLVLKRGLRLAFKLHVDIDISIDSEGSFTPEEVQKRLSISLPKWKKWKAYALDNNPRYT